ncbi:N-acetyltransferase [Micromonospora sonneratiae]|uniref:N-acetyltransferase n=1 Tax=Micromonospora sonneratiae TaxID=1184706 RepID=A0ABW3Y6M2_9ACTN
MSASTSMVEFRTATMDDAERVNGLLTDAFLDGPVAAWLVGWERERRAVLYGYLGLQVERAVQFGTVYVTADLSAVACWLPHAAGRACPPPSYPVRLMGVCDGWADRFFTLEDSFAAHHLPVPHQHLTYLAVAPGQETQGGKLLDHCHTIFDDAGVVTYVEAVNPENRKLYEAHGYQASDPIQLPELGPHWWPMTRTPTTCTDGGRA